MSGGGTMTGALAGGSKAWRRSPAPFGRRLVEIIAVEPLGAYTLLWAADPGGPSPAPGQFAMIAAASGWGGGAGERPYLPRAFSIARSLQSGERAFLVEDVGPGTARLAALAPGEGLWMLGPL